MNPLSTQPSHLRIGRLEVWPERRLMLQDGRRLAIGGRALDLLMALIELRQRIVSREELLDRVWPHVAIEPNNLQVQIWSLRRLVGKELILTVPRRGYRYVGPEPVPVPDLAQPLDLPSRFLPAVSRPGDTQRRLLRWGSR